MDLKSRPDFRVLRERLRPFLDRAREHRFWIEATSLTLCALVAAYAVGEAALARAGELRVRATELEQVATGIDRLGSELRPATPQETLAWRESEDALLSLDLEATEPLRLAHLVARRAEEVGISDLRIRLAHPDSVTTPPPVQLPGWAIESGQSAIVVEFAGGMRELIALLGALPPQVSVSRMEVVGEGGLLQAQAVLLTRRLVRSG